MPGAEWITLRRPLDVFGGQGAVGEPGHEGAARRRRLDRLAVDRSGVVVPAVRHPFDRLRTVPAAELGVSADLRIGQRSGNIGIGFAVPIDRVVDVTEDILARG